MKWVTALSTCPDTKFGFRPSISWSSMHEERERAEEKQTAVLGQGDSQKGPASEVEFPPEGCRWEWRTTRGGKVSSSTMSVWQPVGSGPARAARVRLC